MQDILTLKNEDAASLRILGEKEKLKAGFRETFGSLYLGRRCDLVVSTDSELRALCFFLLRLGLGIESAVKDAFDPIEEEIEDKVVQLLAATAVQVSTHTSKTVDMRIPHRQMMARPEPVGGSINSGDAMNARPVYGCGESSRSMARLFWSRDFIDARGPRHHRTCLLLSFHDPVVQSSLDFLPPSQRQLLNDAADRYASETMPEEPGPKQVFLPLVGDDGQVADYLLVSPVFPLALAEEFYHGIHRFYDRHQTESGEHPFALRQPSSFIQVGGTKPQNIGDLFSTMAGRIRCLEARPPAAGKKPSLTDRVASGFNLLCLSPKMNPEAQWISRPLYHSNQTSSYQRAFRAYLIEAFRLVRVYRKNLNGQKLGHSCDPEWPLPKDGPGVDGLARVLLTQTKLSADEVERYTDALINGIQKQGMPKVTISDAHLRIMRPELQKFLRQWRNEVGGRV